MGAVREPDYPRWDGYFEAYFSAAWGSWVGTGGAAQAVWGQSDAGIFGQVAANGYCDRGVRSRSSLGTGAWQTGAHRKADRAAAGEALCAAKQERRARCGGTV